jgi:Cytochrome P450
LSRGPERPVRRLLDRDRLRTRPAGRAGLGDVQLRARHQRAGVFSPQRGRRVADEDLLDGSFVCIGRTARHDAELAGNPIKEGEPILIYWAAANRDEAEFENPDAFDLERPRNRHLAFGAGPRRCAGSNLARMKLRVALDEIVSRLHDVALQPDAEIEFHSTFNRAPLSVPITFRPGAPR